MHHTTQEQDEAIAARCGHYDSMDMLTSPHGGHLVVVAVQDGTHVCQVCGEPFEAFGERALVEVKTAGATVPTALHARCRTGRPGGRRAFFFDDALASPRALLKAMAGRKALEMSKRALAYANHLADVAKESAKKVVL